LKNHGVLTLQEYAKEQVDRFYCQEEHDIVPFMVILLGAFMLVFILLVLIFTPGKTIARYGIIVDLPDTAMAQKGKNSHLLVLLNDGDTVKVRKPEWFVYSKNKIVMLQETTSMFLRTKKYNFYDKEKNLQSMKSLLGNY
jgi:biopolymer transport protein ExbD